MLELGVEGTRFLIFGYSMSHLASVTPPIIGSIFPYQLPVSEHILINDITITVKIHDLIYHLTKPFGKEAEACYLRI